MRGYAAIGLIRTKTQDNVGGAMRAAMCYGAATVVVQGVRYRHQPSDVGKLWRHIPLFHVTDLWSMIPYDCVPVAIERRSWAIPLPSFCHPERAFYIFGPEDGAVPNEILVRCKNVIGIPTHGAMNLAATVNVVLYDRWVKREFPKSFGEKAA